MTPSRNSRGRLHSVRRQQRALLVAVPGVDDSGLDLGFIVPIAVWTGIGLLRGRRTAIKAAYGLASFLRYRALLCWPLRVAEAQDLVSS
jgi:hypothetical protein